MPAFPRQLAVIVGNNFRAKWRIPRLAVDQLVYVSAYGTAHPPRSWHGVVAARCGSAGGLRSQWLMPVKDALGSRITTV